MLKICRIRTGYGRNCAWRSNAARVRAAPIPLPHMNAGLAWCMFGIFPPRKAAYLPAAWLPCELNSHAKSCATEMWISRSLPTSALPVKLPSQNQKAGPEPTPRTSMPSIPNAYMCIGLHTHMRYTASVKISLHQRHTFEYLSHSRNS